MGGMLNIVGRILESDMLAPQPLFDTTELTHIFVGYEYPTLYLSNCVDKAHYSHKPAGRYIASDLSVPTLRRR